MDNVSLADRVIVVTGVAGRLGRHVARQLADAGAVPVGMDVSESDLQRLSLPEDAATWAADLTGEEEVERCFAEVAARYGRIDGLVHTVGMWSGKPLLETRLEDWEMMMHVNLRSAFLCFREAARIASETERTTPARLVGMASGQGADRGQAEQAAYSASKAGVMRLVEAVADEFQAQTLTAHAVAPSTILFDGDSEQEGVPVERVANLCTYLCTEAGDALNGSTLRAYGSSV